MNIYFAIAIFLIIVLVIYTLSNLATPENISDLYDELDNEDKAMIDQQLENILEAQRIKREKRIERFAKVLSSNGFLWRMSMWVIYNFILSKSERKLVKEQMAERYPHLREAIYKAMDDEDKWYRRN